MTTLRDAIDSAAAVFADAGIDSARYDAEALAAHLAGTDRGRLALLAPPDADFFWRYRDLVAARSARIPLQHLIGTAPFGPVTVQVGPGVFTPRPETEAMLEWALKQAAAQPLSLIVDACTGSGALAIALAHSLPGARVLAVENSQAALDYARRNCAGTSVELIDADVTAPGLLSQFDGRVDLLVSNPPYIPDGAVLDPEVAQHDPAQALFGGPDGMSVIVPLAALAARLLRVGGLVAIEHDDTTSEATVAALLDTGCFQDAAPRTDLAGRPRFVTAVRNGQP
ncbi:peptide chain release factor N(5)-glutamine methyltransferase [Mycolicibacter sp. MYC123]|uniref:Release factor glutamine methyltransferase n=1 Tax=[Mycobacterium] zoologicum TaxID=2872311 RepID=A0ABU5YPX2_9MYCO|nr:MULTISPECIES: peptide chain release factor N(5)-glutamine methyltransferase [unclassified Mycolicibacter]MEB3051775.1 peptide chain release factor N(5)-glutamine methyltransferase [Mycolicibacter sp. MYC123]MEB3065620.1 peptide chain release factor N(5)-glutamine methyltransferase [Mycolicibacter sp. MYC101]